MGTWRRPRTGASEQRDDVVAGAEPGRRGFAGRHARSAAAVGLTPGDTHLHVGREATGGGGQPRPAARRIVVALTLAPGHRPPRRTGGDGRGPPPRRAAPAG